MVGVRDFLGRLRRIARAVRPAPGRRLTPTAAATELQVAQVLLRGAVLHVQRLLNVEGYLVLRVVCRDLLGEVPLNPRLMAHIDDRQFTGDVGRSPVVMPGHPLVREERNRTAAPDADRHGIFEVFGVHVLVRRDCLEGDLEGPDGIATWAFAPPGRAQSVARALLIGVCPAEPPIICMIRDWNDTNYVCSMLESSHDGVR